MAGIEWNIDFSALDALTQQIEDAAPFATVRAAEHLRGVAVELTPVGITGHLVGSAEVKAVDHYTARVYFAGPYARYQHYGLDFRHTHGQALFLEQPAVTEAQACTQIMADTIREATGL